MSAGSGSPSPSGRKRQFTYSHNPFKQVPAGVVSRKLSELLGPNDQKMLSVTSRRQHDDYTETQKSLYTEYMTKNKNDYKTAVRKITLSLRDDEAILLPFRTLILLPFTQVVNGLVLSEAGEIFRYLLWLVRYKVHPVYVAYGLYHGEYYEEWEKVLAVFGNDAFEEQFMLAVALMNKEAQDVYDRCMKEFDTERFPNAKVADFWVKCIVHKRLYNQRQVHHLALAYANKNDVSASQTCICYGKNMVWFKDFHDNYLSRVTVDTNDTIIMRSRNAEPSFDVQRADMSLSQIEQVPAEDASTVGDIVEYTEVLRWANGSRIVKCARYNSEIVIVLTDNGDIYAHACGQTRHILQEESPFVDLVYDYTLKSGLDNLDENQNHESRIFSALALSATGIVYDIYCKISRRSTISPSELLYENLSLECKPLECHTDTARVTQLALLKPDASPDSESWCIITMHHEGSLYINFTSGKTQSKNLITSNVTLIPSLVYDGWHDSVPYIFVVLDGTLKRIFLRFFGVEDEEDNEIEHYDAPYADEPFTIKPIIQDITLTLIEDNFSNSKYGINIASIIEMVQDNFGTLYCLTSTGTVYKCKTTADENQTTFDCSIVELPDDKVFRTFKTRSSEAVDAAGDSDTDMSEFFVRLRLRL